MSAAQEPSWLELLAEAGANLREATQVRNEAIVSAVAAGISQREAARAAGLSHTAVAAILGRLSHP